MKKSRLLSALLFVSLSYVLSPVTAKAAMWDVPVAPGETFRWVFVTSLTIDATSPGITTYNDLVNQAADVATPITGVLGKSTIATIADIEWMAIASTETINAKDNIAKSDAPIYTPTSHLVANDYDDLFDGNIKYPISQTEKVNVIYEGYVWTGSDRYGNKYTGKELGKPADELSIFGVSDRTPWYWIEYDDVGKYARVQYPLYSISEELTVVPVPSALILGATGLLSSTLGLKRLRRKHQE